MKRLNKIIIGSINAAVLIISQIKYYAESIFSAQKNIDLISMKSRIEKSEINLCRTVCPIVIKSKEIKQPIIAIPSVNLPGSGHLTARSGIFYGPSGKETYYNLNMSGVIKMMRDIGYDEDNYPYLVRDDGVKMFGCYVMAAAELKSRPKGTILESSLGTAIVCDTGKFTLTNPKQIDIAVAW